MSRAGDLDRQVTLSTVSATNAGTGYTETATILGKVWASRNDVSDAEKATAGTVEGTVRARFMVRSSSLTRGLKPKDRLTEGGKVFQIIGIKEVGRRDMLEITAEARLD